jgi:hypothetical protein
VISGFWTDFLHSWPDKNPVGLKHVDKKEEYHVVYNQISMEMLLHKPVRYENYNITEKKLKLLRSGNLVLLIRKYEIFILNIFIMHYTLCHVISYTIMFGMAHGLVQWLHRRYPEE